MMKQKLHIVKPTLMTLLYHQPSPTRRTIWSRRYLYSLLVAVISRSLRLITIITRYYHLTSTLWVWKYKNTFHHSSYSIGQMLRVVSFFHNLCMEWCPCAESWCKIWLKVTTRSPKKTPRNEARRDERINLLMRHHSLTLL